MVEVGGFRVFLILGHEMKIELAVLGRHLDDRRHGQLGPGRRDERCAKYDGKQDKNPVHDDAPIPIRVVQVEFLSAHNTKLVLFGQLRGLPTIG